MAYAVLARPSRILRHGFLVLLIAVPFAQAFADGAGPLVGNWATASGGHLRFDADGHFDFSGDGGFYEVRGNNIVFYYEASGIPDEVPYTLQGDKLILKERNGTEEFTRAVKR